MYTIYFNAITKVISWCYFFWYATFPIHILEHRLYFNVSWFLHHDNAPSHKSIILNEFLVKISINIIEKLPYSPDISPADFFLSRELKLLLQGSRFQSIKDIKENSRRELKSIPQNAFKKMYWWLDYSLE